MSDIVPAKTAEISAKEIAVKTSSDHRASVRVSPNGYFAALFLATFFSGLLVYLEKDWAAIALFALTLVKLFFYDIAGLDTISKTVIFVSLGILLLIISFLYNKYKNLIFEINNV